MVIKSLCSIVPSKPASDDDEEHKQKVGCDAQHCQAHQDTGLSLRVLVARDLPGPVPAAVSRVQVVHVQGGLDARQDDSLREAVNKNKVCQPSFAGCIVKLGNLIKHHLVCFNCTNL